MVDGCCQRSRSHDVSVIASLKSLTITVITSQMSCQKVRQDENAKLRLSMLEMGLPATCGESHHI
jgi:hypothetical protein